jgi:hypothetical protein
LYGTTISILGPEDKRIRGRITVSRVRYIGNFVFKRNLQLVIVGVGGLLVGFLAGREIWPGEPEYIGRVVHVPVEIHPPAVERLPPKTPAPAAPTPSAPAPAAPVRRVPVAKPEGTWVESYPDGRKKSQGAHVKGRPDGVWTTWHAGGQVKSQGEYRHGKAEGIWRHFHGNGNASIELQYRDGRLEGPAVYWHPSGAIQQRGEYRKGLKHGLWTTWDAEGHVVREEEFEKGALSAPVRLFDPKGEFPPEAEALAKAEVNGKYRNLLTKVAAPGDRASYKDFSDYGWYSGTAYKGRKKLPQGYWVYVYPYWYIWGETTQKK